MGRQRRSMGMGRSRSPSPSSFSRRPYHAVSRPPVSNLPARSPVSPPPALTQQTQSKQPGMFAQMASTAAGVAVGSAVGHTVGAALTGGMGRGDVYADTAPYEQQSTLASYNQPLDQNAGGPCAFEIQQFLECAQTQSNLAYCEGFSEALRQCKLGNGLA